MNTGHTWALILAAGEGTRLRALTTKPCGTAVPKQFCSLHGGRTLLEDAVARVNALTTLDRICTVVAEQHREWWPDQLSRLPPENIVSQPRNLGTAIGILYPLLHLLARDPQARIVMLPADHYVREEFLLRQSLRIALRQVELDPASPVLLGLQPDEPDSELGYIMPGAMEGGSRRVSSFVEKPSVALAQEIVAQGGLWNTFIIAVTGQALLQLFLQRYPEIVVELQVAVEHRRRDPSSTAVIEAYERLPSIDFSRDVLERNVASLRVVRVPSCGWSDLGTPRRVAETLLRLRLDDRHNAPPIRTAAHINLALEYVLAERRASMQAGAAPMS
jgi:mannose-1-phosphate guanylyltransferase